MVAARSAYGKIRCTYET